MTTNNKAGRPQPGSPEYNEKLEEVIKQTSSVDESVSMVQGSP